MPFNLILFAKLAGVADEDIATDYSLTRIGREPDREKVLKRLAQEPIFADNKDAALNMLTSRSDRLLFGTETTSDVVDCYIGARRC